MIRQLPASLTWRQPRAAHRSYELVSGDRVFASLRFISALRNLAEVQVGGAAYTLKRSGFFHHNITVTKAPFDQEIGRVDLSWKGTGTVEINNGQRYILRRPSMWAGRWEVLDDSGVVLAMISRRIGILRNESEVALTEKGSKDGDLPLILTLAWYMLILIQQEGAAAGAAAGAGGS